MCVHWLSMICNCAAETTTLIALLKLFTMSLDLHRQRAPTVTANRNTHHTTSRPNDADRVMYCTSQGAVGVLLAPPASWPANRTYSATLRCTGCPCWSALNQYISRVPPVASLSVQQAQTMRALAARGVAEKNSKIAYASISSAPYAYAAWSGTSMATPHVSGVAARVWANFPQCSSQTVRQALEQTAMPVNGQNGKSNYTGHGLVQAEAAYDWLAAQPCALQ